MGGVISWRAAPIRELLGDCNIELTGNRMNRKIEIAGL